MSSVYIFKFYRNKNVTNDPDFEDFPFFPIKIVKLPPFLSCLNLLSFLFSLYFSPVTINSPFPFLISSPLPSSFSSLPPFSFPIFLFPFPLPSPFPFLPLSFLLSLSLFSPSLSFTFPFFSFLLFFLFLPFPPLFPLSSFFHPFPFPPSFQKFPQTFQEWATPPLRPPLVTLLAVCKLTQSIGYFRLSGTWIWACRGAIFFHASWSWSSLLIFPIKCLLIKWTSNNIVIFCFFFSCNPHFMWLPNLGAPTSTCSISLTRRAISGTSGQRLKSQTCRKEQGVTLVCYLHKWHITIKKKGEKEGGRKDQADKKLM